MSTTVQKPQAVCYGEIFKEVETMQEATKFVQQLLVVSVSKFLADRGVLPHDSFLPVNLEKDIPLEILKLRETDNREIQRVRRWIVGAVDAVTKKYLAVFRLIISKKGKSLEELLFEFQYNDENDEVQLNIRQKGMKSKPKRIDQSTQRKKNVVNFLKRLIDITRLSRPLPAGCQLGCRLIFRKETPADYLPPNFQNQIRSLEFGQLDSKTEVFRNKFYEVDCKYMTVAPMFKSNFFYTPDSGCVASLENGEEEMEEQSVAAGNGSVEVPTPMQQRLESSRRRLFQTPKHE